METIKLQGLAELETHENLPEIPELVQQYLNMEEKRAEGKFFRIVIEQESRDSHTDGIAYLNELRIEKRTGKSWSQAYTTGMMQYRGAYNWEIDNWDLSLNNPAILKESESELIYAFQTDVGNIKVYHSKDGQIRLIESFNIDDYNKAKERKSMLHKVLIDTEAFRSYISKNLGHRWHIARSATPAEDVEMLLLDHADRDYDAISDMYQFHIWVKEKGIGNTWIYNTDLHHPKWDKFYRIGIRFFDVTITNRGQNFLDFTIKVGNHRQKWEETHNLHIEW